jgi:NADPH-dependent glutamate synthase beta subunit-like oxidoreductase
MLRYGIPEYRLPRNVLDAEIRRIEKLGVKIHINRKVENVLEEKKRGYFDAVFVSIGAHIGTQVDIPARDACQILDAVSYLKSIESGDAPVLGRRVAIYGGGNTAMDAARTAKRLGAEETMIIYRRDREHMPAHQFEADEAEAEGVKINWLRTIKGVEQGEIHVEKMALDEHGRPQPTGEFETLAADSVILALGQRIEAKLFENIEGVSFTEDGSVDVDETFMTGHAGLFAGGDMTPGTRSVTFATGHGRKAAAHIHSWLNHRIYQKPPSSPVIEYEQLRLWYHTDASTREQKELTPTERTQDFREVMQGLTHTEAHYEAKRCYSCGNCFECDSCFGACPEDAIEIIGKGHGYRIDYDRCTGCGACVTQCPTNAISMMSAEEKL